MEPGIVPWLFAYRMRIIAALAIIISLSSCTIPDDGYLSVAVAQEPQTLDVMMSTSASGRSIALGNIYERLLELDEDGTIRPVLAESWELSDDGCSLRLEIRDGILFHDGSTLDSQDAADSLNRWLSLYGSAGRMTGGAGFTGHKTYTVQTDPRTNWMPEEKQTRFHEEYAKNLQNDSLFWGVWVDNMFDYGSARRPYGINGEGLVSLDRHEYKDAYYLYKAMWNREEPTLHIVGKRRPLRANEKQCFRVYSSEGMPQLIVGADTVAMTEYAACQYRSDSVAVKGTVGVKVSAGEITDSMTLRVGNVLKSKRYPGLPQKADPQTTN